MTYKTHFVKLAKISPFAQHIIGGLGTSALSGAAIGGGLSYLKNRRNSNMSDKEKGKRLLKSTAIGAGVSVAADTFKNMHKGVFSKANVKGFNKK